MSKQRYKRGRIEDTENEPIMGDNDTKSELLPPMTPIRRSFTPRSSSRIRTNALRHAESQLEEYLPGGNQTVSSLRKIIQQEHIQGNQDIESFVVDKLEANNKLLRKEFNKVLQEVVSSADLDNDTRAKQLGKRLEEIKHSQKEEVRIRKDENRNLEARLREEAMDRVRRVEEQVQAIQTSHREEVTAIKTSHKEEVETIKNDHEGVVRGLNDRFNVLEERWRADAQDRATKSSQEEASLESRLKEFEEKINTIQASHDEGIEAIKASHEEKIRGLMNRFANSEARLKAEVETNMAFRKEIDDMNLNVIALGHDFRVDEIKTQSDQIDDLKMEKGKLMYQIEQLQRENALMKKRFDELRLEKTQMQEDFDKLKLENGQMHQKVDALTTRMCSQVHMHKDASDALSRVFSRVEEEWGLSLN